MAQQFRTLNDVVRERALELRLRSVAKQFRKTNRLLTSDRTIDVVAVTKESWKAYSKELTGSENSALPNFPGFSSYPRIFLNVSAFDEPGKIETLVGLLGLNYHELSHILITPRDFKKWLHEKLGPRFAHAFNILEDQRIESFFTAMYEPAGKFFTETFVRFIMADENTWDQLFVFSYGRSYLPLEIRQEFEARFSRPDLIPEVMDIINSYKALKTFEKTPVQSRAVKIIRRFVDILDQLNVNDSGEVCGGVGQEGGEVNQEFQEEARSKDRRRRSREERTGEDQSNFWDEDDEDEDEDSAEDESEETDGGSDAGESDDDSDEGRDEDSDGSSEGESDEDSDDERDGSGNSEGEDSDDDSLEDSDSDAAGSDEDDGDDSDDAGDDGSGSGRGESDEESDSSASDDEESDEESGGAGHDNDSTAEQQFTDDELKDYLDEISEAIEQDEAVRDEIDRIRTAMNDNTDIDVIDFGNQPSNPEIPSASEIQAVNRITEQLRRLYAEAEPGWLYGSDVGKLNLDRAVQNPDDFDEWFDEWNEGREQDTGVEAVIAVDLSISMSGRENYTASRGQWLLKRALDEVEAKVTVIGFHSHTVGLYDRNMKADPREIPIWSDLGGSTQPIHALELAKTILSVTTLPNRLFVMLTDGEWSQWINDPITGKQARDERAASALYAAAVDEIPGTKMYVGVGAGGRDNNTESQRHFHVVANVHHSDDMVPLVEKTVNNMVAARLHENRR